VSITAHHLETQLERPSTGYTEIKNRKAARTRSARTDRSLFFLFFSRSPTAVCAPRLDTAPPAPARPRPSSARLGQ
jgi:hypothetical protein